MWWRWPWFGFVGRDGEREGEKRRGLPAPSDKLSRGLMVGEDAHWCGGPAALSLLGGVSSSGDFGSGTVRAAGLPAGGEGGPPLCLAVLDLAREAGRSEKREARK